MKDYLSWVAHRRDGQGFVPNSDLPAAWKRLAIEPYSRGVLACSPNALLGSLWLEVWAWSVLHENRAQLGIDDVRWGVTVHRPGGQGAETDLDVAFSSENRLHFISCKAAAADGLQDEVFEVEARRRPIGGAFAAGMLAHWHPPAGAAGGDADKCVRRAERAAQYLAVPVRLFDRSHLMDEAKFVADVRAAIAPRRD